MTPKELRLAKSIGRAVAAKRIQKGFTQGRLGEIIKVEPETISRIERGVSLSPISRLSDIADALGCPLTDLIRDGSPRASDRALSLSAQLQHLSDADARLLSEMFDKFATRLKKK